MLEDIAKNVPSSDIVYLANDGLKHCRLCDEPVETKKVFMGEIMRFPCICKCKQHELEVREKKEYLEKVESAKQACFAESNMKNWCFEKDDRKNPKQSDAFMRYANGFHKYLKDGKGFLLYGECGTGKTYFAACVANRIIEKGFSALMTSFVDIGNKVTGFDESRESYIKSLDRYNLLIVDDLGAERQSQFMTEVVYNVVDRRYRNGLPMIITTNIDINDMWKCQDIDKKRIYDRILERCYPVGIHGTSRRKDMVKADVSVFGKELGL